jgi:hypothetical protein
MHIRSRKGNKEKEDLGGEERSEQVLRRSEEI